VRTHANPQKMRRLGAERRRQNVRGGTLLGIFIGLVLGLALAAAVAYYLGRSGLTTPLPAGGQAKDLSRAGKADSAVVAAPADKPRFDFYKILPAGEDAKTGAERKAAERPAERLPERSAADAIAKAATMPEAAPAKPADRLWLQAGAFVSESEAENLKARLALSGWEAIIQAATLPDKSVRYRVRLGPYDNDDQLNRTKADLGRNGFDAAVIRNP